MYANLGAGWTFVILSGICVAGLPLPWLILKYGKKWRAHRAEAAVKKAQRKAAKKQRKMQSNGHAQPVPPDPAAAEKV